jgi:hypothetical protein
MVLDCVVVIMVLACSFCHRLCCRPAMSSLWYTSLWQVVGVGALSTWLFAIAWQGRVCTGADPNLTSANQVYPIPGGTSVTSLILVDAPGCQFNSSWDDADYEVSWLALRVAWAPELGSCGTCVVDLAGSR